MREELTSPEPSATDVLPPSPPDRWLTDYLSHLRGRGVEAAVVEQCADSLGCFWQWAERRGQGVEAAIGALPVFAADLADGGAAALGPRHPPPERVRHVLAAVRAFVLHLVREHKLARSALDGLVELADWRETGVTSYSQTGEDLQIAFHVGHRDVTYVDVGCLWPRRHSNSFYFYERGGSGLCIDPNPTVAAAYRRERPRDLFLARAVGASPGTAVYYQHHNPVFNTVSPSHAEELERRVAAMPDSPQRRGRQQVGRVDVEVVTLDEALRSTGFAERCQQLDFLSVDVEGAELDVLRGFSFAPRPRLVLVEHLARGPVARLPIEDLPTARLLADRGYRLAGRAGPNLCFLDDSTR
jgi:FkbM family methyltransferase